jgi:transposase
MPAPYSVDLRWRIVRACEQGTASQREVAALFQVSRATVENLLRLYRRTGDVLPRQPAHTGPPIRVDAAARERIRQWVEQQPDLTLTELQQRLQHSLGMQASLPTLCRLLKALGLRRKKRTSMPQNGTQRAYVWHAVSTVSKSRNTRSKG